MYYPLKLEPVYKDILWGGNRIAQKFNRKTPFERVAESWELCCRDDGMSIIANGEKAGTPLQALIDADGDGILGSAVANRYAGEFPLLFKIIDANDKLSVQVHPDDAYAHKVGEPNGKNELWYIIDAKPGAKLIYGLKEGVTKESFMAAVKDGKVASTMHEATVKPGDIFYIPAGTVHAILDGILIAEIQQNSNTTYRIYDWDRVGADGKGRELHINKALDVINFGQAPDAGKSGQVIDGAGFVSKTVIRCEFFAIDEITVTGTYSDRLNGSSFAALMNIEGSGSIDYDGGSFEIAPGDTLLLPAALGNYTLSGNMKVLKTFIE